MSTPKRWTKSDAQLPEQHEETMQHVAHRHSDEIHQLRAEIERLTKALNASLRGGPESAIGVDRWLRLLDENERLRADREQYNSWAREIKINIDAMRRENDELRAALNRSMVAIDDWLNTYASDLCDEDRVAEAAGRIAEMGTLAYIAEVQQQNRAALEQKAATND